MKKINIYYVFDGLLLLSLVFFLLAIKRKAFVYDASASIIITFILVVLEAYDKTQLTQAVVTNDSDSVVLYKPEYESELKEIAPHTSVEGVDGIKVADKVFKISSGTHVVIGSDNSITTKAISGKIANIIRGGYITSAPDPGWDKLF